MGESIDAWMGKYMNKFYGWMDCAPWRYVVHITSPMREIRRVFLDSLYEGLMLPSFVVFFVVKGTFDLPVI